MLNIIVALKAEARPLISLHGLKHQNGHPFPLYVNEKIRLAISGVGKTAMTSAIKHVATLGSAAWLNLGIAGHQQQELGQLLYISKIIDRSSNWHGFPPPLPGVQFTHSSLITVEQPEERFTRNAAYDMEGSAYFQTACLFQSSELVQCVKLVSDTPLTGTSHINKKWIEGLMTDALPQLHNLLHQLGESAASLHGRQCPHPLYEEILEKWHFTQTQQHQLREAIRRWNHRCPNQNIWKTLDRADNASTVLAQLSLAIQASPVAL